MTHEPYVADPARATETARWRRTRLTPAEHRRLSARYRLDRELTSWVFLGPLFAFFVVFLLVPVLGVFWWSTRQTETLIGPSDFVGLKNFERLFRQVESSTAAYNTVSFALMSVPLILVLSMLVALLLQRISRGGAAFRFLIYFPVLVPGVVAGLIWIFLTHTDFGAFNLALRSLGQPSQNWLGAETALAILALLDVWRNVGYWAIFFLAALIGLPKELYEAAHLDGASTWQRFWHITLPQMRRILLFGVVVATIWGLQIFDTVLILTRGGPGTATTTAVYYVWQYAFRSNRVGIAAAISVVLVVAIFVLTSVQMRLLRPHRGT